MNLLLWQPGADDVMCQATECMRPRVEATNKEFLGSFVRSGGRAPMGFLEVSLVGGLLVVIIFHPWPLRTLRMAS